MKRLAMYLLCGLFGACCVAQSLPNSPSPAPISDPAWTRLQNLALGQPIIVANMSGPPVHCLFAGVSEAYLYCNPPGNPQGVGFRFDQAQVLGVDLDLPSTPAAMERPPQRNYHPAWISSMIAGGIIVGLVAAKTSDAGKAAQDGLIGAGAVGLIGAPLAFLPHPPYEPPMPFYPSHGINLRFSGPMHGRSPRFPF